MAKLELALLVGAESKEWLAKLESVVTRLESINIQRPTSEEPVEPEVNDEPEEAPVKQRASKKGVAKKETPKVVEANEQESTDIDMDDLFSEEAAEDEKPLEPTIDDVRGVVKKFAAKHGKDKTLLLLKKFKVESLPELKKAQYSKFIEVTSKHI